jgi:opacity protein-like surface antigen
MYRLSSLFAGALAVSVLALASPAQAAPSVVRTAEHGFRGGHGEGGEHGHFAGHGRVFIGRGWGDPWWGLGWGWGPYWGPGYYGPGYLYGYGYSRPSSGLKIKVTGTDPKQEQVLVNGNYAGTVDDFNGWTQELRLRPGHYRVEIRASGFKPLDFNVMIPPGKTITYRGELRPRG